MGSLEPDIHEMVMLIMRSKTVHPSVKLDRRVRYIQTYINK